ncbi:GlxA family transcriptional regulator [Undibacterium sp.]|uniref:GlxA family transcriptional regulator n=1 Tax=Undibacterium sp. TaxID=1914977 RepID=UPI00374D9877
MKIYVLVIDGVFDTGLSTLLDTFSIANELAGLGGGDASCKFDVQLVAVRKRVRTSQGLTIPVQAAAGLPRPDVVLVPAMGAKMPDQVRAALQCKEVADLGKQMQRWADEGALLAAACTGTFVMAQAGLLDGHTATTSWWLAPLFRELFPEVKLDEAHMLVNSSSRVTAGAALGHLDLALWLVRSLSPALAAMAARYLVIEPRPSQAAFVIPDHLAHADPVVERFEQWARGKLAQGFSLSEAAIATGASERTLARRLHAVLGKTPLSYFQDLRVEKAVHLLQTSSASIDQIAAQVGYADGVTLRTLLRKKIGRGVRELRSRQ